MSNMLEQGFGGGADRVIIIGPSEDGGFYLFGVTREYCKRAARIFQEEVTWPTS